MSVSTALIALTLLAGASSTQVNDIGSRKDEESKSAETYVGHLLAFDLETGRVSPEHQWDLVLGPAGAGSGPDISPLLDGRPYRVYLLLNKTSEDAGQASRSDEILDGDLKIIKDHNLELYSDSLSTLTAIVEGRRGSVDCQRLGAIGDTLFVTASVTRWVDKKTLLRATSGLEQGEILELMLGDGPDHNEDPLGAGQVPVRIWHGCDTSEGQSYAVWISTDAEYEDHGSGLVVENQGKSDGITVSTLPPGDEHDSGGCGIGVINSDSLEHNGYGISIGNRAGRAIIIGQRGDGEAIEIRRVPPPSETCRITSDDRPASGANIFIRNSTDDEATHLMALYADASVGASDDDLQLRFTQMEGTTEEDRFIVEVDGDTWTNGDMAVQGSADVDGDVNAKGDVGVEGTLSVAEAAAVTGNVTAGGLQTGGALTLSDNPRDWSMWCDENTLFLTADSSTVGTRTFAIGAEPTDEVELEVLGKVSVGTDKDDRTLISSGGMLSFCGQGGVVLPVKNVIPGTTNGTLHQAVLDTAEARIYVNWNGGTQWKYVSLSNP